MFVDVIKAPAGLGKTREFAMRVALSPALVEVYVPTHKLAEEWRDSILQTNPAKRVQVMYGRSAERHVGVRMCARHTLADDLSRAGVAVYQNLCSQPQGPGVPPVKCPYHGQCDYLAQFGHADVYIYTHAHLPLERGALEHWTPGVVIVDESFFQHMIEKVRFPAALLVHASLPSVAQVLCRDVMTALTTGGSLQQRLATAVANGEFAAAIGALKMQPPLSPAQSDAQQRSILTQRTNFKPVALLLEQLQVELRLRAVPQTVQYTATGDVVVHHRRTITRFDRSDGTQPKIFVLDASADREVIRPFFAISRFIQMDVPRRARVVQCHSTRCSTTSLVPAKNLDPRSRADASKRLKEISSLVRRLSAGGRKVLVVGPVAVVGNTKTGALPLITIPPHCELAHFNALRGVNRWESFDVVVIVGRNEPPVVEVEDMARALFFDDPVALRLTGRWDYAIRGYRFTGEALGIDTPVHADSRVQAVAEQLRESESLQAIDRIRLVHCVNEKLVILLSNLPLDIDVHETRSWDELIHGTRLERAWDAAAGVLPLNPTWLAANHPGLWKTTEAAKLDVRMARKKGHFPNSSSIRKMTLFGFDCKLPGQRRWSHALSASNDVRRVTAALKRLVGPSVAVRRGAREP
jgi:hypothetical protein